MRNPASFHRRLLLAALLGVLWTLPAAAQDTSRLDVVIDEIIARENALLSELRQYQPLVETYVQTVKPDASLGTAPVNDRYFLGRLDLSEETLADNGKRKRKRQGKMLEMFTDFYSVTFNPNGFARMMVLDPQAFDRAHYRFEFVRREFVGEIRTLVFEVTPRQTKAPRSGSFTGRIWVEDEDYSIVRFNGIYATFFGPSFHFDSWRLNMAPELWFPAYVYTEEIDRTSKRAGLRHRGQVRIWGYEVKRKGSDEEFTKVLIDAPLTHDRSDPGQVSPVESLRAWEREAEENVLRRLNRAGLLAPEGEVNEVLETVVANLELTNGLDIQPPVRCRVLLTTPLESFTVGHTIVLSRGLIDVLPDEASLAAVLAHELGHVLSGHKLDTKYAFSDQLVGGDRQTMEQFDFLRQPAEEMEADERAVALLQNSPYKDDLDGAGLFLKALAANAEALPSLIRPHFGNRMAKKDQVFRMMPIVDVAPALDPSAVDQVAALPLGGRVKLDPWSARVELMKNNQVALLSAREKLSFQVTPLMPFLARFGVPREPVAGELPPAGRSDEPVAHDVDSARDAGEALVGRRGSPDEQ